MDSSSLIADSRIEKAAGVLIRADHRGIRKRSRWKRGIVWSARDINGTFNERQFIPSQIALSRYDREDESLELY
jgi:hypothetical protein